MKRFKSFDEDIKHWYDYDYIIVNKNLDICFKQIESIISLSKSNLLFLLGEFSNFIVSFRKGLI